MKFHALVGSAVLGLVVAGGLAGAGAAPAAHAALITRPCGQISCMPLAPSMTLVGGLGTITIEGAHWPASQWIELDIYAPVSSSLPPEVIYLTQTGTNGAFSTTYVAPNRCFDGQLEIQAIDYSTNTVITEYAVPGCARIIMPLL